MCIMEYNMFSYVQMSNIDLTKHYSNNVMAHTLEFYECTLVSESYKLGRKTIRHRIFKNKFIN